MPVLMRRRVAVLAAAVSLCVIAGCGAQPGTAWVATGTAEPSAEAPSSAAPAPRSGPASPAPSTSASPSRTGRPSEASPARSKSPTRTPSRPARTSAPARGGLRISNVGLTAPDENGFGKPVRAIHQDGCGSPSNANIWYTVTAPSGRFREAWYEYEVKAPVPLRGKSDFYELVVNGDRANVKTVIGPLPRKPANAGGGTIAITVVVVDNDSGAPVTARLSATLLPCD